MCYLAPFETFEENAERDKSGVPYSEAFINRCRKAALEYDKMNNGSRAYLLSDLKKCVPLHFRNEVFAGILSFNY